MSNLLRLALVLLPLTACVTEAPEPEVDEAISEEDAGKADEVQAYKHYLLYADERGPKLVRAHGGALRCPDDVVREVCEIDQYAISPTAGFTTPTDVLIDELEQHPVIIRGRLVRVSSTDTVHLRASTLHRGLTSVVPFVPTCYRMKKVDGIETEFTRLDGSKVTTAQVTYFDDVDPTPDYWGQPTPAVQAQLDEAVEQSKTRTVFACGTVEAASYYNPNTSFWASQVFTSL